MKTKKKFNVLNYLKKKNVKRFSLFFIVAFIFLIFSKLSNDYKKTIKLKVTLDHLQDEIILENDTTNLIDAYVEAKGFSLIPFIFKKFTTITLDAKKEVVKQPNKFIFDVQKHKFVIEDALGDAYNLISLIPDTIAIPYSKRASKYVPITFNSTIDYAVGYDIKGDISLSNDSVKLVGSDFELSKVTTVPTKELRLKDVKANINAELELEISDLNTIEIFPKSIDVRAEVVRFTEGVIEIPVTIANQPIDTIINYFPKTVKLVYYVDLENYNSIKPSDFSVQCDYSNTDANQSYLIPKIVKRPNYVKRVALKQKRIDFIKL